MKRGGTGKPRVVLQAAFTGASTKGYDPTLLSLLVGGRDDGSHAVRFALKAERRSFLLASLKRYVIDGNPNEYGSYIDCYSL